MTRTIKGIAQDNLFNPEIDIDLTGAVIHDIADECAASVHLRDLSNERDLRGLTAIYLYRIIWNVLS